MRMQKALVVFIFLIGVAFAEEKISKKGILQVIPVARSPQPEYAGIQIVFPENYQLNEKSPIIMQVKVKGFPIGIDSSLMRKNEIFNSNMGQNIHLVIDDDIYIVKNSQRIDPFDDEGDYYEARYQFYLPTLAPGKHTVRTFLCRSYNESLKTQRSFDVVQFYYKNKDIIKEEIDLRKPYLTYNEPSPDHLFKENEPVLLDFYIKNCELSADGYTIMLIIDKKVVRELDKWIPYYIYGLKKGKHEVELKLIDENDKVVPGISNDIKRTIRVE
jgi:hypothetical protein